MLIYADGGALSRALTVDSDSAAWLPWVHEHEHELVTSPLGLTELRRVADPLGPAARAAAHRIATSIIVVRFSDQALRVSAMAAGAVPPFTAIHLGNAVAHPDVDRVATYDPLLARIAVIYGLGVVSPGRDGPWWEG